MLSRALGFALFIFLFVLPRIRPLFRRQVDELADDCLNLRILKRRRDPLFVVDLFVNSRHVAMRPLLHSHFQFKFAARQQGVELGYNSQAYHVPVDAVGEVRPVGYVEGDWHPESNPIRVLA